ncbi:NAD-dependent succinate-semialdehyde dehydrogenase [Nocardioides sp. GY 10127]|uniref:NAD-dependent succinate-semialdehyde dehydrogenase n=1 Tax=Nocardioides sp. GY 10127 TaxID=2569762 RepID=UPI0010A8526A|nr:NAD-dependent succinate-semialdehyde dehydrogenase [Nocardioides sp. GY 10127]TIC79980.1 NAD-dependent succinate-semialdehyde dehydrogenase [Nocardioides sp. GY 10127]
MTEQATFPVENPATREVVGHVPDHGAEEARAAVDRAHAAFGEWSRTSPRQRSEVLRKAYELMLRDKDRLAELMATENGKSLSDAAGEVVYAAEFFRWFSEEAVRPGGDYGESPAGGTRTIVTHRPVGVAALVTPWNFPAAMATRKIGPALAAGCTCVLKPAAETPLTALAVKELLVEAGMPEDAVQVVTTTDAGAVVTAWLEDDRVRKISFTGSTRVGQLLLGQAAERVVNASMELGGNAPLVVTEDADLDQAVTGAMLAKFRNGGQACTAANRFYVHADVAEEFTAKFVEAVSKLKVAPALAGGDIGPLITAAAVEKVTKAVEGAVADGATVAYQAEVPEDDGYWYPATVLTDVAQDAAVLAEEIFGPVAPITTWTTDEEVLALVNGTEYGLASYLFAGDLRRALKMAEQVEAGMVGINRGLVSDPSAPFGGVKQSGLGREGAREGLLEFTEPQYFSVDWS